MASPQQFEQLLAFRDMPSYFCARNFNPKHLYYNMHAHQEKGNENAQNQNATPARQFHNPHSPYQTKQGAKPPIEAKQRRVEAKQSVVAAKQTPVQRSKNALPTTTPPSSNNGGYYNGGGKFLGNHDQANAKVYIVTNRKERKAIRRAHRKGACTPLSEVLSAIELPSLAVRQAMAAAVERSNAPNAEVGDKEGGFHEEGGMFGTDRQGNEKIIPAKPGQYADPSQVAYASVDLFSGETSTNGLHIINGTYHVHPRGEVFTQLPNGKTKKSSFKQSPSHNKEKNEGDIPNAKKHAKPDQYDVRGNSYVIGARNKIVYIYNGNGVVATMPLEYFAKIK